MAVRGLEQTTSRLDQAKRFGGLVLVAILFAALVVAFLILTGLFTYAPAPRVRVLGFIIPPALTAFIGTFTLALTFILVYVYYAQLVRSSIGKVVQFWSDLPTWIQAVVLGLEAGLIAGVGLYITHVSIYEFTTATILVTVGAAWGIATLVTLRVHGQEWTILEWAQRVNVSALIAGVVAVLSGFVFAGVAPGYMPPVVFLVGWAICTYLILRRRHAMEDSIVTTFLTRTGYAQMRQVETVLVSIATGLGVAVIVAIIVGVAGTAPNSAFQRTVLSILIVWPVVTLATSLGWPSRERTDLVIDDISVRTSGQRELSVRNKGATPVNLHNAKVTDANNDLYHIGINRTLTPGETTKFEIPEDFDLATHDRYEVLALPFGLVLMMEATEPRIVTLDGKSYILFWIDQLTETESDSSRVSTS